ncbi:MAG: Hsp20/alpha crystallin family protein [Candidatus Lokiarchaeota archaeon]|nr:Hsp20/alpha crystallin family protein [Candidatus Lokiarchaeota archaeon]
MSDPTKTENTTPTGDAVLATKDDDAHDFVRRIWIPGCACTEGCGDAGEDNVSITFEIPGVKKEDIDLRVIPDGLRLEAKRDKYTSYVSEYAFLCDADPEHVKAEYHDGVLSVDVPLTCKDPYVDGKRIVLS